MIWGDSEEKNCEMDSDDDDDSLLNNGCGLQQGRSSSRSQDKNKRKYNDVIDKAMADSDRRIDSMTKVAQLRRDAHSANVDDDDLRAKTTALSTANNNSSALDWRDEIEHGFLSPSRDDGALSRKEQYLLRTAMDDDLSPCLGARNIINFNTEKAKRFCSICTSNEDALLRLNKVLSDISNVNCDNDSIKSVVRYIRVAKDADVLPDFFRNNRLVKILEENGLKTLGPEFSKLLLWLKFVGFSSGLPFELSKGSIGNLGDAACYALIKLYEGGFVKPGGEDLSMENFEAALSLWVPDIQTGGKGRSPKLDDSCVVKNFAGLRSTLSLWMQEIPHIDELSCRTDTVVRCMSKLTRMTLDDGMLSNKWYVDSKKLNEEVIIEIVELLAKHNSRNSQKFVAILKATAKACLKDLDQLGPGRREDEDDSKAWLCHSAIVRAIPVCDSYSDYSMPLCQFKLHMSLRALSLCLGIEVDSNHNIKNLLNDHGYEFLSDNLDSSEFFLAMGCACAGFIHFHEKSERFVDEDSYRCLAIIECIWLCYYSGMQLSFALKVDDKAKLQILESLHTASQSTAKLITKRASQPSFRRADYLLRVFEQYNIFNRSRLQRLSGSIESPLSQPKLESFFRTSLDANPSK